MSLASPFRIASIAVLLSSSLIFSFAASPRTTSDSDWNSSSRPYSCSSFYVPVTITANTVKLNLGHPRDQFELTDLVIKLSTPNNTFINDSDVGSSVLQASYDIWAELCVPDNFRRDGILEFAVHDDTYDHTYWNFKRGSVYNYAEAALKAGHAIFMYDRLAFGKSSRPDGIKEAQIGTELAVATALVKSLRDGHILRFGKLVAVGHSTASTQLIGLAAIHGNIFDAMVLTSISFFFDAATPTFAAFNPQIAAEAYPERYGNLDSGYIVSGGFHSDQISYYAYPFFDKEIFIEAQSGRVTDVLGVIFTGGVAFAQGPAVNYTKPILVVTGDRDFLWCAGNCTIPAQVGGITLPNRPSTVKTLFPAVNGNDFSVHIPKDTGSALNFHYSAPETFRFIQEWIEGQLLTG